MFSHNIKIKKYLENTGKSKEFDIFRGLFVMSQFLILKHIYIETNQREFEILIEKLIENKLSQIECEYETKLKVEGKFEEYQRNMMMGGIKTHIKEMEDVLLEVMLGDSKETFVTEAGDIEEWRGRNIDKTQIVKDLQEYIQKLKDIVEP